MRFLQASLPVDDAKLKAALYGHFRVIAAHLGALSQGRIEAQDAYTAAPTTGNWQQGDFVRNSAPSELGTASSKYVILGWVCTADGTPGTWNECRVLTGN